MIDVGEEVNRIIDNLQGDCTHGGAVHSNKNIRQYISRLCTTAHKCALELDLPIVITIVDKSGEVIFFYRMEDALLISSEVSRTKAYTAVAMKMATHELTPLVQPGGPLYQLESMVDRKIFTLGGGVPIFDCQGNLLGGLGISGGTIEQDTQIALECVRQLG